MDVNSPETDIKNEDETDLKEAMLASSEAEEKALGEQVSDEAGAKKKRRRKKGDGEEEEKGFTKRDFIEILIYIGVVIALVFFIVTFIAQRTVVSGDSMNPTLKDGDNLIVSKISYKVGNPGRFDIVVFPYEFEENTNFIKRVIGLPGETVQISETGTIYINGEVLEEDYGAETILNPGLAINPITLGPDEYFVLGDNRNNSKDSRFPEVGNVRKDEMVGKAVFRLYPFNKMAIINPDFYGDR